MFHPVGEQPQAVYWRRRLVLLGFVVLLVVLVALTISAVSGNNTSPVGSGAASRTPPRTPASTQTTSSGRAHNADSNSSSNSPHSNTPSSSPSGTATGSGSGSTSAAPPMTCKTSDLDVAAMVGKSAYQVGDQPMVEMQVTNTGSQPCVQDLADRQVELRVYNGESRVWGSHDCQVQPGTVRRTLAVGAPVRVTIRWSGLTSQPGCQGTRQRVGAGTYTLYAALSGKAGRATQFTIGG